MTTNQIDEMEKLADIIIVNTEEDENDARGVKDFIKMHSPNVEICTLRDSTLNDLTGFTDSIETRIETVLKRCGYIFFYITQKFCEDEHLNLLKNVIVACYINEGKANKIVPILAQPPKGQDPSKNYVIPFLLKSFVPLRFCRITKGEKILNLSTQVMKANDKREYDHIVRLLQTRLSMI